MAIGDITEKTSKAKLTVEIGIDSTISNNFNNVNPDCTDVQLATGMSIMGRLQSHTVKSLTRTDKFKVLTN